MIDAKQIKELRQRTGISIAQCKQALLDAEGNFDQAVELLKERGAEVAGKKADRELGAGSVSAYIHSNGNIGTLVELACETDFVSQNVEFKTLGEDLAMHVAATAPADVAELLTNEYIKDPSLKIESLIQQASQKFGERIEITRFARFELGV